MLNLICYLFRQLNKTPYEIQLVSQVGKQTPEIEPTNEAKRRYGRGIRKRKFSLL